MAASVDYDSVASDTLKLPVRRGSNMFCSTTATERARAPLTSQKSTRTASEVPVSSRDLTRFDVSTRELTREFAREPSRTRE